MNHTFVARTMLVAFLTTLFGLLAPIATLPGIPGKETIEELILKLGSKKFKARDEATRRLIDREEAQPALRVALQSSDREVAHRAAFILKKLEQRLEQRSVQRFEAMVDAGAIDQFAEVVGRWPKGKQERACQRAAYRLARVLIALHEKQGGKPVNLYYLEENAPVPDLVVAARNQEYPRERGTFFLRGIEVLLRPGFFTSVIVCSGSVTIGDGGDCGNCVIFASGDVEARSVAHSIIVSAGDVTIGHWVRNSLIIARGKVTCKTQAFDSRIVSGEKVVFGKFVEKRGRKGTGLDITNFEEKRGQVMFS